ncbi:MAG TPA: energy transducer TonB [Blastocatellia bacterium]
MQQQKALFSEAFMVEPSLIKRLWEEVFEASREFRADPKTYIMTALKGDGVGGQRRKTLLRFGLALALVLYAVVLTVALLAWMIAHAHAKTTDDNLALIHMVNPDDFKPQQVDQNLGKQKAGGGGGGGKNQITPPSKGQLPKFSLTPPLIAPDPKPVLRPPTLPVPETVMVDPRLQPKRDPDAVTGLPTGVTGPPSNGPGSGGGIGTGSGGGVGSGDGMGVGPGHGYNMGGGPPGLGGSGRNAVATAVDTMPRALNHPRPNYTEEARKNKVQGVVRAKVLISSDGSVKSVNLISHLPDGLDEQAITAIHEMRFSPAMKSGQPVNYYVTLEVEFNLR